MPALKNFVATPDKLKTDEELLEEFNSGNENSLNELLARYKRLVSGTARRFFLVGAEHDDLIQEGMIGLYNACKTYKNNKNSSFKTYAYICVNRQIQSAVKKANSQKNKILNSYISLSPQGGIKIVNSESVDEEEAVFILPSKTLMPDEKLIEKEKYEEILTKVKTVLSKFEFKVLAYYLQGEKNSVIAEKLNKNYKSIDNSLKRIKNKLSGLVFAEEENSI